MPQELPPKPTGSWKPQSPEKPAKPTPRFKAAPEQPPQEKLFRGSTYYFSKTDLESKFKEASGEKGKVLDLSKGPKRKELVQDLFPGKPYIEHSDYTKRIRELEGESKEFWRPLSERQKAEDQLKFLKKTIGQ